MGKKNRRQFIVSLDVPEGVEVGRLPHYIEEAVGCWAKSFDPEDPLFDLNADTVKAKIAPKKRRMAK